MRYSKWCASLLGLALLLIMSAGSAQAQATRTWISGVGDDVNPCSRTAPCKTFAGAISKTAAGGEIDCLDPGGFGAVTIVKAITLDCGTFPGGILSSGTNGIVVNAGAADKIIIRNLVINGAGVTLGTNGIRFLAGKELLLDRVVIQQISGNGIEVTQGQNTNLILKHVTITQGGVGIKTTTTVGSVNGIFDDVLITDMTSHGIEAVSATNLTIRGLNTSRNVGDGVHTDAAGANITVLDGVAHGNSFGYNAVGGTIRIHDTTMISNNTNLSTNVLSDGTNRSSGNTNTNVPTAGAFTIN
jgi:hypothetical protein